jgi:hypothetical protein
MACDLRELGWYLFRPSRAPCPPSTGSVAHAIPGHYRTGISANRSCRSHCAWRCDCGAAGGDCGDPRTRQEVDSDLFPECISFIVGRPVCLGTVCAQGGAWRLQDRLFVQPRPRLRIKRVHERNRGRTQSVKPRPRTAVDLPPVAERRLTWRTHRIPCKLLRSFRRRGRDRVRYFEWPSDSNKKRASLALAPDVWLPE